MEGVAAFGKVAVIEPTVPSGKSDAMNEFIRRHRAEVIGVLSGFDRLRIRGTTLAARTANTAELMRVA